jgi:hypothetical protein
VLSIVVALRSEAEDAIRAKHSENHLSHEDGCCIKDARGTAGY